MTFPGNDWLLIRDEPGLRDPREDDDDGSGCRSCGGEGHEALNGDCFDCDPSCAVEVSPVRHTFDIDAAGVVTERPL